MRIEIVDILKLADEEIAQMEALYRCYYEGAPEAVFRRDLAAKDRAILLFEEDRIRGFSTLRLQRVGDLRVLFSGDTVVDAANRNQAGLAGAFGHVMARLNEAGGDDIFWFLICKGARTYRFLPTFFKRFTPGAKAEPELAEKLRRVASAMFPKEYDPATGVLHFGEGKDRLRGDALRMDAESVRFRALNPGWAKGDELGCLVPLAMANLNRLGERVIAAVSPRWRE